MAPPSLIGPWGPGHANSDNCGWLPQRPPCDPADWSFWYLPHSMRTLKLAPSLGILKTTPCYHANLTSKLICLKSQQYNCIIILWGGLQHGLELGLYLFQQLIHLFSVTIIIFVDVFPACGKVTHYKTQSYLKLIHGRPVASSWFRCQQWAPRGNRPVFCGRFIQT